MNIKEAVVSVLKNWNNFSGRACRSEFWYFYLSYNLILILLGFVNLFFILLFTESVFLLFNIIYITFQLLIIIPYTSVTSRRLQDRGISGWWQLSYITIIGIFVILIILMLPAKEDENKWGRNPLLDM
tara:strand:- start:141 stop:524 length:384 start_codon:yes stop_codon:yes gene_type:complete